MVTATALCAFLSILKIIPSMAKKTKTCGFIRTYEDALTIGILLGGTNMLFDYSYPLGSFFATVIALFIGIFVGSLAMCLAEIFDVIPIMMKRTKLRIGIKLFVLSLALGKAVGAITFFYIFRFS